MKPKREKSEYQMKTQAFRDAHDDLLLRRGQALVVIETLTRATEPNFDADFQVGSFVNHLGVAYTSNLESARTAFKTLLPDWEIDSINWVRDLAKVTIRKIENNRVRYTARKLSKFEGITLLVAAFRVYVKTLDSEINNLRTQYILLKNTLDRAA